MSSLFHATYTNGIRTAYADALQSKNDLEEIVTNPVELEYNGTAPGPMVDSLIFDAAFSAFVMVAATFALIKSSSGPKPNLLLAAVSGGIILASLAKLLDAFEKLQQIQCEKEKIAESLAGRVSQRLGQNPNSRELLVCHSQGAHICNQVIEKLPEVAGRIDTITLGGMEQILPHPQADRVNFAHKNDPVPNFIGHYRLPADQQAIRNCKTHHTAQHCLQKYGAEANSYKILNNNGCETAFCHGVTDYFKNPQVAAAIQGIFQKNQNGHF